MGIKAKKVYVVDDTRGIPSSTLLGMMLIDVAYYGNGEYNEMYNIANNGGYTLSCDPDSKSVKIVHCDDNSINFKAVPTDSGILMIYNCGDKQLTAIWSIERYAEFADDWDWDEDEDCGYAY